MKYITKVLLGVDQFANTIIGGSPDETISARAGRRRCQPGLVSKLWWTPLAWTLNKIQKDHVEKAICHETDGSQQEPSYGDVYDPEDTDQVLQDVHIVVQACVGDVVTPEPKPAPPVTVEPSTVVH